MLTGIEITPDIRGMLIGNTVTFTISTIWSGSSGNSATLAISKDNNHVSLSAAGVSVSSADPEAEVQITAVSRGATEITVSDSVTEEETWGYISVIDLTGFITPVTGRAGVRTRTTAADFARICTDLNILALTDFDTDWTGRIVLEDEWTGICSALEDLAEELEMDAPAGDTDYSSLNYMENIMLQYKNYLEGDS